MERKDAAQLQSLVLCRTGRASSASPSQKSKAKTFLSSTLSSEEESFVFSYWLGVTLLMRDLPCSPGVVGSLKTLLNNVLQAQDLLGFIGCCSDIRSELVQSGVWTSSFKSLNNRWARSICCVIEHAVDASRIRHPSDIFDQVVTFLGWLKRLPVCVPPEKIGFERYLECDARLSNVQFDNDIVARLRSIWFEWFDTFRITQPFRPKHGSGSTADSGRVRASKWANIGWDQRSRICLHDEALEKVLDWPSRPLTRAAKLVFVPKQAGRDRAICMEPAWLQFLQQGVADQLVKFTHTGSHPLSKLVNIFDQGVNRCLCADAWLHRLATIDLSDASDSVSWRLIKRLTFGMPLFGYLYATRSDTVIFDGTEYRFDKFAPMGSALCFPIECILFASIVELAHRIHYGKAGAGHRDGCSVYGDDIVVPSEIDSLVRDILESLGFVVNHSKSYSSGGYYESCGVEYLYGCLVNSIKHPREHLWCPEVTSPSRVGLVTDLANTLLQSRYFLARRSLLKFYSTRTVRVGSKIVPFSDLLQFDDRNLIPIIDDYKTGVWDRSIQRRVVKQLVVQTTPTRSPYDFQQWKSDGIDRDRSERLADVNHLPRVINVHPKWSTKAVTFLCRSGAYDLLETGDVEAVRTSRTGRPGYKVRRKALPR